ncbi:MAG: hypothetical protein GDA68_05455 [Nitrospira sp. CR2.1]|nr:hypothetical protein [Nitrospira sp. CR2.1]
MLFTEGTRAEVAARLTALVAPHAIVHSERHIWMPNGLPDAMEGKLGEAKSFLSDGQRQEVTSWWLAVRHPTANTPNWDIISQAVIGGREGVILVEAKAHDRELIQAASGKSVDENASESSHSNHVQIGSCIQEASKALSLASGLPWNLSLDAHYQMSNRFAWAWKLAKMGIPVVLIYLGFLQADEMADRGAALPTHAHWRELVAAHSQSLFPSSVWGVPLNINGTALIPLVRSTTQILT